MLYQTDHKYLMKKIISKDLRFNDALKCGLAIEQVA